MRKIMLAATALVALTLPAAAADLPTKAPRAVAVVSPYDGDGLYFGIETYASQQTVNLSTPVPGVGGTVNVDGASIGGVVGYTHRLNAGNMFVAGECDGAAQNVNGANSAGGLNVLSVSGPWRVGCVVKFGAPWDQITAALPNLPITFPTFTPPAGVASTPAHVYLGIGGAATDISAAWNLQQATEWNIAFKERVGAIWQLSSGKAVDTFVEHEEAGRSIGFTPTGPAFTPAIAGLGHSWKVGAAYLF